MIVVERSNVHLAVDERGHDLLQLIAVHLAVPDADARLRHEGAQPAGHGVNVKHTVVQVKNLAARGLIRAGSRRGWSARRIG